MSGMVYFQPEVAICFGKDETILIRWLGGGDPHLFGPIAVFPALKTPRLSWEEMLTTFIGESVLLYSLQ